jgi:uncharacterized protein VirK/YbjX
MSNLIKDLLKTAPLVHRVTTPGGLIKRAKYCARGLAFARYTREWFAFLQMPELSFIVKHNPWLYHKLQRPYLNRILNTAARLEALQQHYRFVLTHFPVPMMEEAHVIPGLLLAELTTEKTGPLELRLACSTMEKEGDFMIYVRNRELKKRLSMLSFSVWKYAADRKEIYVGGLQGDNGTGEDIIVAATRALYGIRPKALVFFVLQQLAACWGITHIQAVGDNMHIYRHFQKFKALAASYDEFWPDRGGVMDPDGFFHLPVAFVPRDIATIRVNKRQMYRRRYVMLEQIAEQIRTRLSCPPKSFAQAA